MAGQSLNNKKIVNSLQNWLDIVYQSKDSWEGNNLHIDEIETLKDVIREEWIEKALLVFDVLLKKIELEWPFKVFLHIDLSNSQIGLSPNIVSLKWLKDNLNEFTPPSFNCTSIEYYSSYYMKSLTKCNLDLTMIRLLGSMNNVSTYFRIYFDESEQMYSRELYLFS
jgi:hypothetical protein